jgi:hypothetical protein
MKILSNRNRRIDLERKLGVIFFFFSVTTYPWLKRNRMMGIAVLRFSDEQILRIWRM